MDFFYFIGFYYYYCHFAMLKPGFNIKSKVRKFEKSQTDNLSAAFPKVMPKLLPERKETSGTSEHHFFLQGQHQVG